ncbi:uncharacterized protein LOC105695318 isoform X2 [Orussus abietinus]|uniref:uncharacterized protein LOC105695318 isoform X2 n=1 Tax=Orussus abietinus TaxID=222816 RepID=UPI0006254D4F|nr:uncharacterized protein LOC105695318 isoform X2 [Orussus abietinus]
MGPRGNEKPEQGARRSPRIRVRGSKSSPKGSRASPGIAAKRAKLDLEVRDHDDANFSGSNRSTRRSRFHITSLPTEILVEILSYLSLGDLYALRQVSTFFERLVSDPAVWRAYEVVDNEMNTSDVIDELKRMPFLRKFSIAARSDSDDILRQLSLTNRNLEELHVSNCTGAPSIGCDPL